MSNTYLLISMGDPNSIGYEIALKSIQKIKNCNLIFFGNLQYLKFYINKLKIKLNPLIVNESLFNFFLKYSIPKNYFLLINTNERIKTKNFSFKPTSNSGKISLNSLNYALNIIKKNLSNKNKFILITLPVSKKAINLYFKKIRKNSFFNGHTEYIAKKFNVSNDNVSMLMIGRYNKKIEFKVLLLTRHIPLKEVSRNLKTKNIITQILNSIFFLLRYEFRLEKTLNVLICGLNPHLGEGGTIGSEEKDIIYKITNKIKKILNKKLKNIKISIYSPTLTEKAFEFAMKNNNTLIVCLYHDQAMVPLKILCHNNIANITVGLPFIRISPGHGTAYDIAGKGIASINPTLYAIKKALKYLKI